MTTIYRFRINAKGCNEWYIKSLIITIYSFLNVAEDNIENSNDYILFETTESPQLEIFINYLKKENLSFDLSTHTNAGKISKKELPISNNTSITTFQNHVTLLQIPLVNRHTLPWYYSNFVNIIYYKDAWFEYVDAISFYEQQALYTRILNEDDAPINNPERFLAAINKNFYIYLWLDKFSLQGTAAYQKHHDIHPVLIYGYDLEQSIYQCVYFEMNTSVQYASFPLMKPFGVLFRG